MNLRERYSDVTWSARPVGRAHLHWSPKKKREDLILRPIRVTVGSVALAANSHNAPLRHLRPRGLTYNNPR